ncbi:MAG: extracellular solute-binding protein, partial [Chloroflexota bacterium]|nr:extracellular solute-binding protein [Chloroflexota bacterium]
MRARPSLVAALALLLAATACITQPPGTEDPTSPPAASPTSAVSPTAATPEPASPPASGSIVVYSGRSPELVGPLIDDFQASSGIQAQVRYADTAELAALLLEEGDNTPADVFFAQDAGALGAVAAEGMLAPLPDELLDRVPPAFRSPGGEWVGASGRARVVVYDTRDVDAADLPQTIDGFTDPAWRGRIGWAPTNGS